MQIILASNSLRRLDLLRQIGIEPVVIPSHVPEVIKVGEPPEDAALRLAIEKASEVAGQFQEGLVIGADTIVVIDGEQLGKPEDRDDAKNMLRLLSGRSHTVITGMAVIDAKTSEQKTTLAKTKVKFKPVSDEEINAYIATGDPMDKAGAYGIQGRAAAFIDGIEGCYSNVVGLPLSELAEMLKSFGCKI
ncbi:MAG: septum formation inhibitor Maf [Deltaproteobacteria bacterium]|nr:septum formation inhibitor Maf [Deltaproteobacteria bacterium]